MLVISREARRKSCGFSECAGSGIRAGGWDDNAGGERRYSCQVTNGWLARAGRDGGGSAAGMGELARDFYISSKREESREWEAGRRLCGEWCQQSVARFPAGEGQVLLSWTGHCSNQPQSSRLSRHSPGEVQRTDTGGADCAGQLRARMTDGRGGGTATESNRRRAIFLGTCFKPSEFPE